MSDEKLFFEAISNFTLEVCTPIYWHDLSLPFPKDVRGASCFFLRFDAALVGITANHVVEIYESALKNTPSLVLQVRLLPFDLLAALIDRDQELDIATFAVSDSELASIGAVGRVPECGVAPR